MSKESPKRGKPGVVALEETDLEKAQGGFAPLKPAEFVVEKKAPKASGFFIPEVDDEVIT